MATSGKKPHPMFAAGLMNQMSATMYFAKAQQAYAANQWQQVKTLAQSAISISGKDKSTRYSAQNLLAAAFFKMNQIESALGIWLDLNTNLPNNEQTLSNIGYALTELKRYEEAIQYLKQTIKLAPQYAMAHLNLGTAYSKIGNTEQAKLSYLQATKINPHYAKAKFFLGDVLQEEGLVEEALTAYEQGLAIEPYDLVCLNNMIFVQHALYPFDMNRYMKYVRQFGVAVAQQTPAVLSTKNVEPHAPLRIGIVSADFCQHIVYYFIENVLAQIKQNEQHRSRLTLVAYANQSIHDTATEQLRHHFDVWRQVDMLSDASLAEQISQDNIDILIDLSGHTKGNRLPVFARKPAPLQISWLGYWGSTGLTSIDYVLADPICVPVDEEHLFLEKIWRLPHLRYCVSIPTDTPAVSPPPCTQNQHIVFGCYQFVRKINNGVLSCWSNILMACPLARLRIQSFSLDKPELREQFIQRLIEAGIDQERVELIGGMSTADYLKSYAEVDILLDTFPYPGGTTTAQALWMGVPTLTLATQWMLGRQGQALMLNAGLPDWVAHTEDEYVKKAINWASADQNKRQELANLRASLRETVAQSPVFNAKEFTSNFVEAMYAMWNERCEKTK